MNALRRSSREPDVLGGVVVGGSPGAAGADKRHAGTVAVPVGHGDRGCVSLGRRPVSGGAHPSVSDGLMGEDELEPIERGIVETETRILRRLAALSRSIAAGRDTGPVEARLAA